MVLQPDLSARFAAAFELPLTGEWNLINRPVIPIFADRPVVESDGFDEVDGLGDIALVSLLSPAKTAGSFLWGAGPTFIFPTASKDELGQEKWQAGPAAVGLHLGKEWIFGAFPQHWWSFAGNNDPQRKEKSNESTTQMPTHDFTRHIRDVFDVAWYHPGASRETKHPCNLG